MCPSLLLRIGNRHRLRRGRQVDLSAAAAGFRSRGRAGAGEEGQDFADGAFPAGGFCQREVRLDLVAVAAAVSLLGHGAGVGQVGDAAVSAAGRSLAGYSRYLIRVPKHADGSHM